MKIAYEVPCVTIQTLEGLEDILTTSAESDADMSDLYNDEQWSKELH